MNNNRCLMCREIIPEGREVCPVCSNEIESRSAKRIYVCSPYRYDVVQNTIKAKEYCRKVALLGFVPIAPHIYFTQFLNDFAVTERYRGMRYANNLLQICSEVWVFGDHISEGMKSEIDLAHLLGIPVKKVVYIDGDEIAWKDFQEDLYE